jgi:hypothetical protein
MPTMTDATPRCLDPKCDHPDSEHVATPELATHREIVVFCSACRHHEVGRVPRHRFAFWKESAARSRRRFAGPS